MSSVDLEQLVFKVDTKELESAVDKVEKLESAVSGLNEPLRQLGDASKNAGQGVKELAGAVSGGSGGKSVDNSMDRINKIIAKQIESMRVLRNESLQLKDGTIQLGEGFTKMQSNALASLKIMGATTDQVQELANSFKQYNDITGINTFDKSASGLIKMQKEVRELSRVNELLAKGLNLTRDEVIALARDSIKLEQVFNGDQLVQELKKLENQFVEVAQSRNTLLAQTKESEEAAKREAKVQAELQRAGMEMNDAAVAQFRKNEEKKQAALRQTTELIENTIRQTQLLNQGLNEREAKKFVQLEQQGIPVDDINRYIAAERERKAAIDATKQAQIAATKVQDTMEVEVNKLNAELERQRQILELLKQGYNQMEASKIVDLQGKGFNQEQINTYVNQLRAVTAETNKVKLATREREKETRKVAQALEYLTDVERRLDAQIAETNRGFNERDAAQLIKIENAIRQSGISADVAAAKMQNLRNKLQTVADQRAEASLRNLSRAISVQMGDVGISLASGMNPLLVMIQQGDQIRGAIEQAKRSMDGMANADMMLRKTMMDSSKMIAQGFIDTGKAIGTFFVGTILAAGDASVHLAARMLGLTNALTAMEIAAAAGNKTIKALLATITVAAGALVALVSVGIIAAVVAFYRLSKANDELALSLAKSNGALAGSTQEAVRAAKAMNDFGVSTTAALGVINEMAKVGGFVSSEIAIVTKSAVELNRVGAASVADTVKAFAEMKKDPVDALLKLGVETGRVSDKIAEQVIELNALGNRSAAAALAMQELARVNSEVAAQVERDLSALGTTVNAVKNFFRDLVAAIQGLLYEDTLTDQLIANTLKLNAVRESVDKGMFLNAGRLKELEEEQKRLTALIVAEEERKKQQQENTRVAAARQSVEQRRLATLTQEQKYTEEVNKVLREANILGWDSVRIAEELERVKRQSFNGSSKSNNEAEKEAERLRKQQIADMERINDLLGKSNGLNKDFNDIVDSINRRRAAGDITETERLNALAALVRLQPVYVQQQKAIEDARKQDIEDQKLINGLLGRADSLGRDYYNTQDKLFDILERGAAVGKDYSEIILKALTALEKTTPAAKATEKGIQDLNDISEQSIETIRRLEQAYMMEKEGLTLSSTERERRAKLLEIENELIADNLAIQKAVIETLDKGGDVDIARITKAIEAARRKYNRSIQLLDASKDIAEWQKVIDEITKGLSDFVAKAITGRGRQAGASLRRMLEDQLKRPLSVMIEAELSNIKGNLKDFFGNSKDPNSPLGRLKNIIPPEIVSAITKAANTAATALAAYELGREVNRTISGGYAVGDSTRISNLTGQFTGGVINRLFGRKLTGTNIEGSFGPEGFSGASVNQLKGGLFRSDKTIRTDLGAAGNEISKAFDDMRNSARELFSAMNVGTSAIDNFTTKVVIDLTGLSEEDALKKLEDELKKVNNQLVLSVAGFSQYVRVGEEAVDALNRLSTSLTTVNSVLRLMNVTMFDTSMAGADLASNLVDLFGGISEFAGIMDSFFGNFFTQEEQLALKTAELTRQFAELGFAIPATRDQFRQMVEAQDLTTKSGRENYAALLRLSQGLNEVLPKIDTLAGRLGTFLGGLLDAVVRDLDRQIAAGKRAADEARRVAQSYFDVAKSLREFADGLSIQNNPTGAQGEYLRILAAAQGGDIDSLNSLSGAASNFLDASRSTATSTAEFRKQTALVQQQVRQAAAVADVLGTGANYQAQLLDINVAILEEIKDGIVLNNITADLLAQQLTALENVTAMIQASTQLTVATMVDNTGELKAGLVDNSGAVVATIGSTTTQQLISLEAQTNALRNGAVADANALISQSQSSTSTVQNSLVANASTVSTAVGNAATSQTNALRNGAVADANALINQSQSSTSIVQNSLVANASTVSTAVGNAATSQTNAIVNQSSVLGLSFGNSITGQTLSLGNIGEDQISQLQDVEAEQIRTANLTQLVSRATGESSTLLNAVLGRLEADDLGTINLIGAVNSGNHAINSTLKAILAYFDQAAADAEAAAQQQAAIAEAQTVLENIFNSGNNQISSAQQVLDQYQLMYEGFLVEFGPDNWMTQRALEDVRIYEEVLVVIQRQVAEQLEAQRQIIRALGGIPAFASGGMHSGGMRLVGENGPELEVTGPSRIFSASQTASMISMSNSNNMIDLFDKLEKRLERVEYATTQTAVSNNKIARILDRVTPDGESLRVSSET